MEEMEPLTRITTDPKVMHGKPCVRGTRIPAELVLNLLASGMSEEMILEHYPDLESEDIRACVEDAPRLAKENMDTLERKVRFLADENISPKSVEFLRDLGFDAVHVRDVGLRGKSIEEIMDYALREKRTLLTFDREFADVCSHLIDSHSGVIRLRLSVASPEVVNRCLSSLLFKISRENLDGSFLTTDGNYLIR